MNWASAWGNSQPHRKSGIPSASILPSQYMASMVVTEGDNKKEDCARCFYFPLARTSSYDLSVTSKETDNVAFLLIPGRRE